MISAEIFSRKPGSEYIIHLNHPEARELWMKHCAETGHDDKDCAGEFRREWEQQVYRKYIAQKGINPDLHPCAIAAELIRKILC